MQPIIFSPGVGAAEGLLYAVGGHDGPLVRKSVEVYNPELRGWKTSGQSKAVTSKFLY